MNGESFEKFKQILSFVVANKAVFYKEKFAQAGFDPAIFVSLSDVSSIPLLTREELTTSNLYHRLYLPIEDTIACGYTSGTTARQLLPLWRNYFSAELPQMKARKILILAVQPWRSITQHEWFKRNGMFVLCGDINNLPLTAELSSIVEIDGMYCTPTVALLFASILKRKYLLENITSILAYGEPLSTIRLKTLQNAYPLAEIQTHYACSEVGPAGNSCPSSSDHATFHKDKNFFYEIIDPETGKILPKDTEGELVITTLTKVPTPMIRYRTGDIGITMSKKCSCEKSQELFRIVGRVGFDVVKVGGFEFKAAAFEDGLLSVSDKINQETFEVHIFEEQNPHNKTLVYPKLVFRLEPKVTLAEKDKKFIIQKIMDSTIIGSNLSITDAEKKGYISKSSFEFNHTFSSGKHNTKRKVLINHMQ